MTPPISLRKLDRSVPSGGMSSPKLTTGLPDDVARDAANRLGWACLIYALTYTMAYFGAAAVKWISTGTLPVYIRSGQSIIACIAILMALGLFRLSRDARIRPARILDLGLIFEVVGALGISAVVFWGIFPTAKFPSPESVSSFLAAIETDRSTVIGISWTCVWIVMFPMLAPVSPGKALLGAMGAASTGLITVFLSQHFGATSPHFPPWFFIKYFLFTTYLCAGIACFSGHGIYKLGTNLRKARQYGSYRLVKLLGRGGMGEVWRAKHRMLARPAAIKLIRPAMLGANEATRKSLLRRFEREAQATAALQSYHTIEVYDFGTASDGSFYYVMELLDGLDLDTLIKRFGPVPAKRAIHLLRQVCHSLTDAHENGMIHRDIKPANIYACRLGPDYDFIKVLDFGLVKADPHLRTGAPQLTQVGSTIGSPGFMAPEMALGKPDMDGRVDLYALGCVGYWLITGQLVFDGPTTLAILVQQIQAQAVPPSQRSELEIPTSLEKVILSCLEKDPDKRPPSARELDRLLADCDTPGNWTAELAEDWWDLHVPPPAADTAEEAESRATETPVLEPKE